MPTSQDDKILLNRLLITDMNLTGQSIKLKKFQFILLGLNVLIFSSKPYSRSFCTSGTLMPLPVSSDICRQMGMPENTLIVIYS